VFANVAPVTTAQTIFVIALGAITVLITCFALYVASSTMWGDRWYRRTAGEAGPRRRAR
jgi:membrane protein implicated in regulation of membrane protease activity